MPKENLHLSAAAGRLRNGSINEVTRAGVEATIALATEQARTADALETANLIAVYNMSTVNCEGLTLDAAVTREAWAEQAKTIAARVGLA